MKKPEIIEMPNFEYTPQGFIELKKALKDGKIVKNPFAKFYKDKIEVTVIHTDDNTDIKEARTKYARGESVAEANIHQ